jgi:hypothetical protein
MAYTAGDLTEATFNHPTIGSGTIQVKASQDNTYDLGGYRSADDAAAITGSGVMIDRINNTRWIVNLPAVAWDMNINLELETINRLAADPVPADWTFGNINGSAYRGSGKPVGDLAGDTNNSTFSLIIQGGGKLSKIA